MMNVMMVNNHADNNPFADYLWMGDMEKFDEQVEAEMEDAIKEEEFIKSCIEQLLDEEEEQTVYFEANKENGIPPPNASNGHYDPYQNSNQQVPYVNGIGVETVTQDMGSMYLDQNGVQQRKQIPSSNMNGVSRTPVSKTPTTNGTNLNDIASKSKLNPNAAPFFFNVNAQEFVPRSFTTRPTMNYVLEQPSHMMPTQNRYGR